MPDEEYTGASPEPPEPPEKRVTKGFIFRISDTNAGRSNPFGTGFTGHPYSTRSLALSPDGTAIAFSSGEASIQVCYPEQPERSFTFTAHTLPVSGLAWSPNGRYLASTASSEGVGNEVLVWEITTQHVVTRYQQHEGRPLVVCWSPDGTKIVSAGLDKAAHVWEALTGRQLMTYEGHAHAWVSAVAWSPDGTKIASTGIDGTVQLWEVATGTALTIYRGHHGNINAVAWSPDGSMLASGGDDQGVQVWHATTRNLIYNYTYHSKRVMAVDWSPDGQRVRSSGWDGTVREWDATTGQNVWLFHMPTLHGEAMAPRLVWTADLGVIAQGIEDRRALVANLNTGRLFMCRTPSSSVELQGMTHKQEEEEPMVVREQASRSIKVWGSGPHARILTYRGHSAAVTSVAWSPDSTRAVSGSHDTMVQVWETAHMQTLLTCRGHSEPVTAAAWSPDGTKIASSSLDKTVRIWDAQTGAMLLIYKEHRGWALALAWSPDGRFIASTGADEATRVWDIAHGQTHLTYQHPRNGAIQTVGWSPDGQWLATGYTSGVISVWDALSGQERFVYRGHVAEIVGLQWLADGQRIASLSERDLSDRRPITERASPLHIWRADGTGEALLCENNNIMPPNAITCSPDGKYVAINDPMHMAVVYDTTTGQEIAHVGRPGAGSQSGRILSLAWSPDGKYIAAAADKGGVHLWMTE